MTNAEFLKWFAEAGHKWRGWPRWNYRRLYCRNDEWMIQVATSAYTEEEWLDTTERRYYYEAACLVRDFLRVELAKCVSIIRFETGKPECFVLQYLGENRHHIMGRGHDDNAALVAAVEAQMVEEKRET